MNQIAELEKAIEEALPGCDAEVSAGAGPGHYNVTVRSSVFVDKPQVQAHQLVYGAIAHLMAGDQAPVHAIDRLQTIAAPELAD